MKLRTKHLVYQNFFLVPLLMFQFSGDLVELVDFKMTACCSIISLSFVNGFPKRTRFL